MKAFKDTWFGAIWTKNKAEAEQERTNRKNNKVFGKIKNGLLRLIQVVFMVAAAYVICITGICYCLPVMISSLAGSMGVTADMDVLTMLAVWILPSVAIVLLMVVVIVYCIRAVWKLLDHLYKNLAYTSEMAIKYTDTTPSGVAVEKEWKPDDSCKDKKKK